MKKHNQIHKDKVIPSLPEAAIYLLNLGALGYVSLPFVVIHPSFVEPYGTLLRIGILVTFALTFAATLLVLRGQASKLLLKALRFLTGVTAIALLALAFAFIQDLSGVRCPGLFGSTQTCVSSAVFALQVSLPSPFVFIPLVLAFNTAFIIGLRQSLRKP